MRKNIFMLFSGCLLGLSAPALAIDIFACEPEWQALAHELAGDKAKIYVATSAYQDPHRVQARPGLISAVRRADLVFCTGGGLESGWLPVLLQKGSNPQVLKAPGLLLATEQVSLLEKPQTLERSEGDIHAEGNPHIHLDPRRVLTVAEALAQRLQEIDAANARFYQTQLEKFRQQWHSNLAAWQQQAQPLRNSKVIVHHRSWSYLLDWLGMDSVAELEPKPGLPPTPSHLASLTNVVRQTGTPLILYTDYNGSDAANWLANHSEACAIRLPMTVGGMEAVDTLSALYGSLINALLTAQEQCRHG